MGWLESRWEDIDPSPEGRPARRYYWITESGPAQARRALAVASATAPATAPARHTGNGNGPGDWGDGGMMWMG